MKRNMFKLFVIAGLASASFAQAMDNQQKPLKPGSVIFAGYTGKYENENVIVGPGAMVAAAALAPESKVKAQNSTSANGRGSVSANNMRVEDGGKVTVTAYENSHASVNNNIVGKNATVVVTAGNANHSHCTASVNNNIVSNGSTIRVTAGLSKDQFMDFFKK